MRVRGSRTEDIPLCVPIAGDVPRVLESDVRGDIGSVRELIADNIQNVKGGKTTPICDNS